jgi:hypothetical protein
LREFLEECCEKTDENVDGVDLKKLCSEVF